MNLDALNLAALRPILPLPLWQKAAALTAVFILIVVSYIYLGWMPLAEEIELQQAQVEQQRILLKKNQRLASNLPKKKKEFAKLEKQLQVALNMLPKKSQIPDLLENVSWAGKDSGLEFTTFQPRGESVKQIYAEVPNSLNVKGSYRQLLTFLKRVGEMPRIVSVNDLSLSQVKTGGDLSIQGTVTTYRFVEAGKKKRKGHKGR
ncbi:MAG: type 4a pilus biogenesis protein PilO [Mariprofundaceae bacterium]